jgi:hypothetical protein
MATSLLPLSREYALVNTWLDVVAALYEGSWNPRLHRFRSPFAFRGLGRDDLALSSTLVRLSDGRADAYRLEQALLRNFRKYAHGVRDRDDSLWSWLARGQHHGLPTRLLDWSYSPLVALHFATECPADFDRDGVVWCVNFVETNRRLPTRLRRMLDKEASETFTIDMLRVFPTLKAFDRLASDPFVAFVEPPAVDRRILHQLALFSLMSSPSASLERWLHAHPELCRKVRVPAHLKWEIRDNLDQSNVNERVLFPGLDGLSRWLTRYYTPLEASRETAREASAGAAVGAHGRHPLRTPQLVTPRRPRAR